jgi:predicted permease
MDLISIITALAGLFVIIGIGFAAKKYGILNGDRLHLISHILVNVSLPALSIVSLQVQQTPANMSIAGHMIVVAFACYLSAFVIGLVLFRFIPSTLEEKGIFQFMLIFSNSLFMGIPVATAMFGASSLFYVILFNVPFYLLVFTLGVWLLNRGAGRFDIKKFLLSPGLVAAIVGLVFFLDTVTLPGPVDYGLGLVGSATTPLAMLVVGALLATIPLRQLAGDWRVYLVTALRLVIFPVVGYLVLSHFIADKMLVGVAVLMLGMPVAANLVLFCEDFHMDSKLASQGVFITTILCLVTIPLLGILLL